jgi:hypothetical protein
MPFPFLASLSLLQDLGLLLGDFLSRQDPHGHKQSNGAPVLSTLTTRGHCRHLARLHLPPSPRPCLHRDPRHRRQRIEASQGQPRGRSADEVSPCRWRCHVMRIGTRGTTPHRLESPKERSATTWPTIWKILEDHDLLSRRR